MTRTLLLVLAKLMMPVHPILLQLPWVLPVWYSWGWVVAELVGAAVAGVLVHWVFSRVLYRVLAHTPWRVESILYQRLRPPARLAIPLLFVLLARAHRGYQPSLPALDYLIRLTFIAAVTWFITAMVGAFAAFVRLRHDITVSDNREARRVHTQVNIASRSIQVLMIIGGFATALMIFPGVRQVGASLLASAGVAGIIVGLAARPVLENIIAGIQIGLAQPIRLDDVVLVESEWGRVEEITLTYIVVKTWDERRLILPLSRFLTQPFQNWTRSSTQLIGTVLLWVDYTAPVERIRQAAHDIVANAPKWDRRVFNLQVTDATEQSIQLRILVSAANSGDTWDLRVFVREQLITWLQHEIPHCLPQTRVQLQHKQDDSRFDPSGRGTGSCS